MSLRCLTFAGIAAALMLASTAGTAAAACCDKEQKAGQMACCDKAPAKDTAKPAMPCCEKETMPCCEKETMTCCTHQHEAVLDAVGAPLAVPHVHSAATESVPVRRTAVVWFDRPVWIGRNVLMGKYVIEHDTARQARGEPCTYLYAADNLTVPAVTFHCTHMESARAERDSVTLHTKADGVRKFVSFQFSGEDAAHGFPAR
jgi:hypothetical protein